MSNNVQFTITEHRPVVAVISDSYLISKPFELTHPFSVESYLS